MTRDVDCMACLTTIAAGLEDASERHVDSDRITHAVVPTAPQQGLQACDMRNNKWVGWVARNRKTCRVLVLHGGVWS